MKTRVIQADSAVFNEKAMKKYFIGCEPLQNVSANWIGKCETSW